MVKIHFYTLVSLFVLASSNVATAALIHINDPSLPASADGFNITRDTSTGLEWLDLDVSAGRSYEDLTGVDGSNEFDPGGDFEGFRYATFVDIDGNTSAGQQDSLLKSADLGVMAFSDLGSYTDVRALLDYVGCSGSCGAYGYALGTAVFIDQNNNMVVSEVIVEAFESLAGNSFGQASYDNIPPIELDPFVTNVSDDYPIVRGNWLVRDTVIPVPAAVWLFGSGLIGLIGVARRKKS